MFQSGSPPAFGLTQMQTPRLSFYIQAACPGAISLIALVVVAICLAPESASARRPSFIVIQADDQAAATMHAIAVDKKGRKARVMPNTLDLIGKRGVEFTNYYSSTPLCSPSRSTLLSGQYAHTNGLPRNSGRLGGALGFSRNDAFSENLAVSLQRAGYFTAHFGDFINHYGNSSGYDKKAVPPGWDKWATAWTPGKVNRYYGYRLNVNGHIKGPFGNPNFGPDGNKDPVGCPSVKLDCNYSTDVLTTRAVRTIKQAGSGRPMYMQVDYEAPHDGPSGNNLPEPARRHTGTAARTRLPEPPGFNERNIDDKPAVLRNGNSRLSRRKVAAIEKRYRAQLETLRAMDDGVGRIVAALKRENRLGNTYMMVTSDHGYFLGEHRFGKSKFLPHEPASGVQLLVRGPRAKKGARSDAIVGNVDLAPTIADLAGARLGLEPDGRSFANVLRRPGKGSARSVILESYLLRSKALEEHLGDRSPGGAAVSGAVPYVNYTGLRAGRYKYISYEPGSHELYDLKVDPYELSNKVKSKRYRRVVRAMDAELEARRFCAGIECRKGVRDLPKPKPKPNRPGKN